MWENKVLISVTACLLLFQVVAVEPAISLKGFVPTVVDAFQHPTLANDPWLVGNAGTWKHTLPWAHKSVAEFPSESLRRIPSISTISRPRFLPIATKPIKQSALPFYASQFSASAVGSDEYIQRTQLCATNVGSDGPIDASVQTALSNTKPQLPPPTVKRKATLLEHSKTLVYLSLWYYFNVLYNIANKNALTLFPLPNTVATLQMYVGLPIFLIPWLLGLRSRPQIFGKGLQGYLPFLSQSMWHSMVHISSVVALGAGAISFVHIVKAAEPALTAGLSSLFFGANISLPTYLSLLPIIAGVGLASLKELSFTWKALLGAMLSNIGSSMRGIEAKRTMSDKSKIGKNLSAANIYAMVTIFSTLLLTPALLVDSPNWMPMLKESIAKGIAPREILKQIIASGIWYYLYNEIAFIALGRLNPVTHAVANTVKRVFLILTSVVVFGSRFTPLGAAGSGTAVLGTLLYSLSKQRFG